MYHRSIVSPLFSSLSLLSFSIINLTGCGGGDLQSNPHTETNQLAESSAPPRSLDIQQASTEDTGTDDTETQNQVIVFVHGNAGGLPISDISSFGSSLGSLGNKDEKDNEDENEFFGFWCDEGITPLATTDVGLSGSWLGSWLMDEGYDVWVAHYTSNSETTDSIVNNAACIGQQISDVAKYDADGQVTVIAASLGGLVSRYYLEGEAAQYPYQNDVERLFTLGTPNKGMPVDLLVSLGLIECDTNPAFCEIRRSHIKKFNQSHERAPGVIYNFIGGAAALENVEGVFSAISAALSVLGTNDGLALTNSALGRRGNIFDYEIQGPLGRFKTDETHGPGIGLNSYFTPRTDSEGNQIAEYSTAYEGCIKPQLAGEFVYCE